MNAPESPLVWPDDFPPTDPWRKFFWGVRWLGPDISFFKALSARQATRTTAVMLAWAGEKQLRIALDLGECIRAALRWKTPYFIPADKAVVVAYGPRFLDFEDFLWEEATREFEKRAGKRLRAGFWELAVDWGDKNATFGELIGKLTEELDTAPPAAQAQPTMTQRFLAWVRELYGRCPSRLTPGSPSPHSRECRSAGNRGLESGR